MSIKAVVFDAYGTLFDVYAVTARLEACCPGQGSAIAQLWRDKQIEYSRLVSLSDPSAAGSCYYESFWSITCKALNYALMRFDRTLSEGQIKSVLDQYYALDPFPENADVLSALKTRDMTTAILSNGDPGMLSGAVTGAGFDHLIDHVLSVDEVRQFKTTPQAYALVEQRLGVKPTEVLFVSSNGWDILGAQWFGFRTCWINRAGLPAETLGPAPEHQGQSLQAVLDVLAKLSSGA
jgi:2-haloacid dehalogenase